MAGEAYPQACDLSPRVISKMQLCKLLKNAKNFINGMPMEFVRNKCNNKMEKWAKDSLLLEMDSLSHQVK